MKNRISKRKFGRPRAQYRALLRNLFRSLVIKKEIKTTEARAKELKPYAEKIISKCLKPEYVKNKAILKHVSPSLVPKLKKLAKRYESRTGGFVSIVKITEKRRDSSPMARIKLV